MDLKLHCRLEHVTVFESLTAINTELLPDRDFVSLGFAQPFCRHIHC